MSCFRALFSTIFSRQNPKNHDLDVLTEMGLECLYSKQIQDRLGYSALFGIPTYFQVLWAVLKRLCNSSVLIDPIFWLALPGPTKWTNVTRRCLRD